MIDFDEQDAYIKKIQKEAFEAKGDDKEKDEKKN